MECNFKYGKEKNAIKALCMLKLNKNLPIYNCTCDKEKCILFIIAEKLNQENLHFLLDKL